MSQPAKKSVTITPNNATDLPERVTKIYVTGAGNIKFALVKNLDAEALTLAVTAGQILEIGMIRKVFATGTTATGLIGLI